MNNKWQEKEQGGFQSFSKDLWEWLAHYTGWAKSRYTVTIYCIPTFGPTCMNTTLNIFHWSEVYVRQHIVSCLQVIGCYCIKWVLYSFILRSVTADGTQPKNGTILVVQRFDILLKYIKEAHAGTVGWGTVWVWFQSVIEMFHWHNPSSHTMALGSTQPPTEMSTRNIFWWVKATIA